LKVSVITFQNNFNYGSALQTFATYMKFKEYANDVEVIDYTKNMTYTSKSYIIRRFKENPIKGLINFPAALRWQYILNKFICENLNVSPNRYNYDEDFVNFPLHDGIYCTGSDQVWNTSHNNGILSPLYLGFVPSGKRKITYASSIGSESLSQEDIDGTMKYIKQYEKISVREESAVKILKEQYGYQNVIQIVDPILAMSPEFWIQHTKNTSNPAFKVEYILIYNFAYDAEFESYAKALSKKTGLPLVRICPSFLQALFGCGKSVIIPDIFEFVSLVRHAKYLLTDSFHGTAFSMNLNTEPIVIYPKKFSTRLSSILSLLGAEQRVAKDFSDFDVINRPVDWSHVNSVLEKERERVDEFLQSIFHAK